MKAGQMTDEDGIVMKDVRLRLGRHDFHFDCLLPHGRIIAVTGPSGAGKSTVLNLLAGFETPDRGRISLAGTDVTCLHPSERPVSVVFQEGNLFSHLDLFTNIGLGISPSMALTTGDRDAITAALTRVGLPGYGKRLPGTLSGGERQRVAFARALVRKKPILLLDEPFASLDPGLRREMATMLIDLHRESRNTVLIVSHDPQEVRRVADHALFVENDAILLSAPIEEFLVRRDHPSLQAFLQE